MATSSSSTKKAARLAQKGKGKRVRFQGGTLFPLAVAIVVVLGLGLVVYARQSRPAADATAPRVDDHWHHVYGFYLCDTWVQLAGDAEEQDASGRPLNLDFARTGIHSHDDGLIHWHPFSSAAVGRRAQLSVFLDVYEVEISNDTLRFPERQFGQLPPNAPEDGVYESGETTCEITDEDGDTSTEDASLYAVVWDNFSDTDDGTTFIAGVEDIAINMDGMVVSIVFAPDDVEPGMPPWAPEFEERAANDLTQLEADQLFGGIDVSEDGDIIETDDTGTDDSGTDGESDDSSSDDG
ncbi:MAG: hypothetical protein AAGG08_07195 [Actinomycetota bacterium]